MLALYPALKKLVANPKVWLRFHTTMTVVWALLIIPSLVWWRESVPWLVFMSAYAIVVGHFGAVQGSRAEDS